MKEGKAMKKLMLLSMIGIALVAVAPAVQAQPIVFGVGVGPVYVGPPPVCPYGYYSYYPYACAPYGYYGPEWFSGGVFIGAGPWFHRFHGRPYYRGGPRYWGGAPRYHAAPRYYGHAYGGGHAYGRAPAYHGGYGHSFHGGRR